MTPKVEELTRWHWDTRGGMYEVDAGAFVLFTDVVDICARNAVLGRSLTTLSARVMELEALQTAAQALVAARFDHYRAGNNRMVGIQDDSGEKCWIVPFDAMADLERALQPNPINEAAT